MKEEYRLILDQKVLDEYNAYYFKTHPKAKKVPIERPILPGLNQMLVIQRMQMATLKSKWKEFGVWWVKKLGYEGLNLEHFEVTVNIFMPTRRRFDLDNFGAGNKVIFDSFTEAHLIVDDDYKHLSKLTICGDYDKENPRTEIILTVVD